MNNGDLVRKMNYDNRYFKPVSLSPNSEIPGNLVFHYRQTGNILTCTYCGGSIEVGHLIGLVDQHGTIDMRYHQVNQKGEMMTGICHSRPETTAAGLIRLHENWQWTSGDKSRGQSVLEEIHPPD